MAGSFAVWSVLVAGWICLLVIEWLGLDALRFPGHARDALGAAFILSLIMSAGFVEAISRNGRFYLGMAQPALGAWICRYFFRIGSTVAVALAAVGIGAGLYVGAESWAYLVLIADEFVVLTALWMACGIVSVRRERWRATAAIAAGVGVFAACRATGQDALLAQLVASAVVLVCLFAQVPSVFAPPKDAHHGLVPLPQASVLVYRALPLVAYGALFFGFLLGDRLIVPTSGRLDDKLGRDIALVTLLLAGGGINYAHLRFIRLLQRSAGHVSCCDSASFTAGCRWLHLRALATVVAVFLAVALLTGAAMRALFPSAPDALWITSFGAFGYLMLAIGLFNGLVLFSLDRRWTAVTALAVSMAATPFVAADGPIRAAALFAVLSTVAVRTMFRRTDFLIALA